MRYLSVKNFSKHQHYKDRRPPWIKLHVEVLDDYAFACLQDASKAHLMLLWVLASKLDNRIPYDLAFLSRKLGATSPIDVDELVLQGFIEVSQDDSKPLASRKQSAMPETEGETETETELERRAKVRADVDRVVTHYVSRHPKRRPGEKDRKLIARHLATYTADELCEAIDGNATDDWAQRTGKHELSWVLRDNGQIDTYREKSGSRTAPVVTADGKASDLWTRYRDAQLLTPWPRPELERIGQQLVDDGCYPDLAAFLDEIRLTKPWELADSRTDHYAIGELSRRLGRAS